MFGMLDYRAYKLFRVLGFPLRVIVKLLSFACIGLAILIAQWTELGTLPKLLIGYASFEGSGLILGLLWFFLVSWPAEKIFFWVIDVIPARGENEEEARQIALHGRIIWLAKKLNNDIGNWTYKDTDGFVSALNWRAVLLFGAKEKFQKRVAILRRLYEDTGRQPGSFSEQELQKYIGHLNPGLFEQAIVNAHYFFSIIAGVIITMAVLHLNQ
jgi:hypothetical protein